MVTMAIQMINLPTSLWLNPYNPAIENCVLTGKVMVKQTKGMISNGEESSERIIQSEFKASTVLEADAKHDVSAISYGASPFVKVSELLRR